MLTADIQPLEPGGHVILFELDGTAFGADGRGLVLCHQQKKPYSVASPHPHAFNSKLSVPIVLSGTVPQGILNLLQAVIVERVDR